MRLSRLAVAAMMPLVLPMKAHACSACFSATMEQGGFFRALSVVILITLATTFIILGVLTAAILRIEKNREASL